MHFTGILAIAISLTATVVNGRAFKRNLDVYATFYDDDACTKNPGEAVDTQNPGCLEEGGRYSIYFQSGTQAGEEHAALVVSPASGCNCQSTCINNAAAGNAYCMNLNDYPGAANAPSYRFVGNKDGCDPNNC